MIRKVILLIVAAVVAARMDRYSRDFNDDDMVAAVAVELLAAKEISELPIDDDVDVQTINNIDLKQNEQYVTNLRKGSKCKSNIVCSLLRGSCMSHSSNCSGREVASVCKGSKCKCCIEVDLQTELQSMVVNLTAANTNMNTRIEALISLNSNQSNIISNLGLQINSLTANLTDANSELTNELQLIKENQETVNANMNQSLTKLNSISDNTGTNGTTFVNLKEELESLNANINRSLTLLNSVAANSTCPEDSFKIPNSSHQCFKIFRDKTRSWFQAKQKCQDEVLILAKPLDPEATRRYLLGTYGNGHTWINARGSGSFVMWGDGQSISNSSPLWMNGEPSNRVTGSSCMWLETWSGALTRGGPFRMYDCSTFNNAYTLCEWVPT